MAPREGELFKEKIEVSLDGRQIFCLFCGGAVIASLVFVLGVMIGRRVEARTHPERAGASAASDPLAALDQLAAGDPEGGGDLAFADALRGDGEAVPLGPVDVSLEKAAMAAKAEPAKAEPAKAEPPKAEPPKAEPPKPPPAKAEVAKAEPAKAEPAKPDEVSSDKARFTLQLSSFQDRAEADAFAAELQRSGYQPYVVPADVEGKGTWFRVRVGRFPSQDEALLAKTDFERKQKMIAYVTRLKK